MVFKGRTAVNQPNYPEAQISIWDGTWSPRHQMGIVAEKLARLPLHVPEVGIQGPGETCPAP